MVLWDHCQRNSFILCDNYRFNRYDLLNFQIKYTAVLKYDQIIAV